MGGYGIGELAHRAGVGIDTVRFYERRGLLAPSARLASGYRRYGEAELQRLRFIRRAKALGFSLEDAGSLLALSASGDIAKVRAAASQHLDAVERRIAELQRIRSALAALVERCPGHADGPCPILNALSGEESP